MLESQTLDQLQTEQADDSSHLEKFLFGCLSTILWTMLISTVLLIFVIGVVAGIVISGM